MKSVYKAPPIYLRLYVIHTYTYVKKQYIYGSERLINICMNVFFSIHYYCLVNCHEYKQIYIYQK